MDTSENDISDKLDHDIDLRTKRGRPRRYSAHDLERFRLYIDQNGGEKFKTPEIRRKLNLYRAILYYRNKVDKTESINL